MNPQTLSLLSLLLALIVALYNLFFAPSRSDRKELERRVAKVEVDDANHGIRLDGFYRALENVADESARRCQSIEQQLSEVGRMREDLAGIKAEMKHVVEGYGKLSDKIDRLYETLRSK